MIRIAYILLSNGLEYDDRIRKEMISIRECLKDVEFKIFAFSGEDNHEGKGVLSYGVPYEFVAVKHREKKRKDVITMLRKEYSFYSQIKPKVKDFDILWCCDEHPFFFPLFSHKTIVWDLHEIPHPIIGTKIKDMVFHYMEKKCRLLIHANPERLEYLVRKGVIKRPEKSFVVRNYPDKDWLSAGAKNPTSFVKFKQWQGGSDYVYIQGIQNPARFPWETLSAIMEFRCIKAVVLGKVSEDIKSRIRDKYPDSDDYIYYAGQVVQEDTSPFIANCKFSIVFYSTKLPNNRYCEPNRMFQCLGMGKPVLVGCNEPMRNVVLKYDNGIVLESEGSIIKDNVYGIIQVIKNYNKLKENADKYKHLFAWESQMNVFEQTLNIVTKKI